MIETPHRLTKGDAYVTSDGPAPDVRRALLSVRQTAPLINSGGLGTMGLFAGGIKRQLALPEENRGVRDRRRQHSDEYSELSTALQYNLPVVVVNLNNRYLGMVKQWQT